MAPEPASATTRVHIFGQTLTIKGVSDDEYTQSLAAFVTAHMEQLSKASPLTPLPQVAMLAAMNVAHELFELRHAIDAQEADLDSRTRDLLQRIEDAVSGQTDAVSGQTDACSGQADAANASNVPANGPQSPVSALQDPMRHPGPNSLSQDG